MEEYICKFCGKGCKNANSLRNHERLCKNNPNRQNSNFVKFNNEREKIWNKGLTKETDKRLKKASETLKKSYENGNVKIFDHKVVWTKERREEQSKRKKVLYSKYPEKHPNAKLSGNKNKMTYPEQLTFEWLNDKGIKNEHNYHFVTEKFNRYVDFYLPELNIFIEVDGEYWHTDTEKDISKDKDAFEQGIKTIRIKPKLNVLEQLEKNLKCLIATGP